jgi:hypothetical protein
MVRDRGRDRDNHSPYYPGTKVMIPEEALRLWANYVTDVR